MFNYMEIGPSSLSHVKNEENLVTGSQTKNDVEINACKLFQAFKRRSTSFDEMAT